MTSADKPADSHDLIRVRGARENNLRGVDVDLPKRRMTVFTGVSGSGKSSLVFDTIAAESRRLINETYSSFVQGFMPSMARPDVDSLSGLTPAILVDQEQMGANARSTVGTATDAAAMLRVIYSRIAEPHIGSANAYSFNVPTMHASGMSKVEKGRGGKAPEKQVVRFSVQGGMCPTCEGLGQVSTVDTAALYDPSKSLLEGALQIPGYVPDGWYVRQYAEAGFLDPNKPIGQYSAKELDDLLWKAPTKVKLAGYNATYEGLVPRITKSILSKDRDAMQPAQRAFADRVATFETCPDCHGTRLNAAARGSRIDGLNIAEVTAKPITELAQWVRALHDKAPEVTPLIDGLSAILDAFVAVGLGYMALDRPSGTLSGGESQRVKMVRHLGSALTDVTYVFDEPTAGLHPHDIARMNALLLELRDKGNTVLVVEHKPEVIEIADHVVDLGPMAGTEGGRIMYEGDVAGLRASESLTGRHLADRAALKTPDQLRAPTGAIEVRGATEHNLRDVDVDIPLGVLVAVTGVAGSGKSSLIHGSVSKRDGVVAIDQSAIRGSRRSSPATYVGLLEPIRKAFAKANGVKPALFSPNSEGACPVCKGAGVVYVDLAVMAGVAVPCEECGGKRFKAEVLEYRFGGRDISQVLDMPIAQAHEFFAGRDTDPEAGKAAKVPAAAKILERLMSVGLGYVTLGQPLTTLSGGERQRLKLAVALSGDGDVYVLDEPTTGLHLADIEKMLEMLDHLVDSGKSVIVIEHHLAVMAHADWVIDLGPGAGDEGGRVVFEGTPADMVAHASSGQQATLTGEYLARYVAGN